MGLLHCIADSAQTGEKIVREYELGRGSSVAHRACVSIVYQAQNPPRPPHERKGILRQRLEVLFTAQKWDGPEHLQRRPNADRKKISC
jgi:hypothetical protein